MPVIDLAPDDSPVTPANEAAEKIVLDLPNEYGHILAHIQDQINELDTLVQVCDQLLDKLQPTKPGRIRITWWKRTRQNELVPVFVQLRDGVGGRWYLEAVSTRDVHKYVRSGGPFKNNYKHVTQVVGLAKAIVKRRGHLIGITRQHMSAISNTLPYQRQFAVNAFTSLKGIYLDTSGNTTAEVD